MEFTVSIQPDADGYTGRECPKCEKYFKIKFGTGLPGEHDCHCPYCNHVEPHAKFFTPAQVEYAQSIVLNRFSQDMLNELKKAEIKPDRKAIFSIGIKVEGSATPIIRYSEKELEERVTCSSCTLQYTTYGAFAFCPDCGVRNSLQIINANFDIVMNMLDLAKTASSKISPKLIENALEDAVSSFDGFGREHCSSQAFKISFQSIEPAREKLQRELGVDIADGLSPTEWMFVCEQFQKRHLLAHKMGIVDAEFLARTRSSPALLDRKIAISDGDVRILVQLLRAMAIKLYGGVART
jgi:hypothetical protein